ncbi:PREDICTED: Werner syndrome ATP-dependent helicase homolog [Acropora digitifera]|uniref:Werner syndrome ATP-dependent helicase homolog n=1 Tax=Acropora digitifera TaxID=70779 RepID=UPI00077AD6ED|nr:PREDICTED: Werner syndrome ATP-dependent helicase homolog [Acropora digitifera]
METIGENVTGSVLKKVCADRSCFNSTKNKETTFPLHLTRGRGLRLHSVLTSSLAFLVRFSVVLFFRLAGRFQNRLNKNVRSSQGTKRSKFVKKAQVFVIDDASSCDKLLQFHRSKYAFKLNYIGIDCEWVNNEGQQNMPVALLQIATPLCDCFLVRLCKMDSQMPQIVKEILEDKTVLKFGVGIQDDAKRLWKMFGIHARGCVDLRQVIQRSRLDNEYQSCEKTGLNSLAEKILGVRMDKSWRISSSDWEADKFTTRQIEYAMNDALVASHIFLRLVERKINALSQDLDGFVPLEKWGNSLTLRDACVQDKTMKLSSSMSIEHQRTNSNSDFTLNLSENLKHFQRSAACYTERFDRCTSKFSEKRSSNQVGMILKGKITDKKTKLKNERSVMKEDSDLCSDSQICAKPFQDLVSGVDYYKTTVDLNKFESKEMMGYLSRDKVIGLFAHPGFTQTAGSLCQSVLDLEFKKRKKKAVAKKKDSKEKSSSRNSKKSLISGKSTAKGKPPPSLNCMNNKT